MSDWAGFPGPALAVRDADDLQPGRRRALTESGRR